MNSLPLTEEEVDRVIAAEKSIDDDLNWRYDQEAGGFAKCELRVANALNMDLRVHVTVNLRDPSRFSFNLSVSRAFAIRRLCANRVHRNKHTDTRRLATTHVHHWTNKCRDRWARDPESEVPEDIRMAFEQFCKECNIAFAGKVSGLPALQMGF